MKLFHRKLKIRSSHVILLGFLLLILTGALLLRLPFASRDGRSADFLTCLFTSTSSVCVTGLIVRDTATSWTLFGQIVILSLIQLGGIGVVTAAVILSILSGRRIGLIERQEIMNSISAPQVGGVVRLTRFLLRGIALFEGAGALVMLPVFVRDFGFPKGAWYAVFHSVSAFCNAGFGLMGIRQKYSSLTSYASDPIVNITVMLLIVIGGLGFLTWNDIRTWKFNFRRYRLQSRIVLTTSLLLVAVPAVCFYFLEYAGLPGGERVLCSLFQSVTARTAGFNTADYGSMSEPGVLLTILLMLIGGSPGSTAGGMKTTTFALLILSTEAAFRKKSDATCFGRRIPIENVRNAFSVAFLYMGLFLLSGMVICRVEGRPLLTCLFETASAIGTVGLSMGLTPHLHTVSKLILIALMYFGRVGGLTIVFAVIPNIRNGNARCVPEKVTVG
jgi:trk system potassium uptake protein TrkH